MMQAWLKVNITCMVLSFIGFFIGWACEEQFHGMQHDALGCWFGKAPIGLFFAALVSTAVELLVFVWRYQ